MMRIVIPVCLLLVLVSGCKKPAAKVSSNTEEQRTAPRAKIQPCALLEKEEVGKIQDTTITETKSSENSDGILLSSQCYYAAALASASVSLAVTQADPAKPSGPVVRQYWDKTFGRFRGGGKTVEKENEKPENGHQEEEKENPPVKVDGVGEEAFWTVDRVSGVLYVLKNDVFIRISVGGPGKLESKLEKSKVLAAKALTPM